MMLVEKYDLRKPIIYTEWRKGERESGGCQKREGNKSKFDFEWKWPEKFIQKQKEFCHLNCKQIMQKKNFSLVFCL